MKWCQLHCLGVVSGALREEPEAQSDNDVLAWRHAGDVQGFDLSRMDASSFQLESLILAQNERWRQA
jgi:hypothetical protein